MNPLPLGFRVFSPFLIRWIDSQKWVLLSIASFFSVVAAIGHFYVVHEITSNINDQLTLEADDVIKEVAYADKWDLHGYRQADPNATRWFLYTAQGIIIDIERNFPALPKIHATFSENIIPGKITLIHSEVGEDWRILAKPLNDGQVIVGINDPNNVSSVDQKIEYAAKEFGKTVTSALNVQTRDIDKDIEYALLDKDGFLKGAWGGIPLRIETTPLSSLNRLTEMNIAQDTFYVKNVPILTRRCLRPGEL